MDNEVIKIKFSSFDCKPCPSRIHCTTSKRMRRTVTIRSQEAYEALQAGRRRPACSASYASCERIVTVRRMRLEVVQCIRLGQGLQSKLENLIFITSLSM